MSRIDSFGLARQSSGKGDKKTAMEYYPPVETVDPGQQREALTIEETVGNRFPTGMDYGTRFFEVAASLAPRFSSMPRLFSAFLGQPTTAAGAGTGSHVHTHDPAAAGKIPEWHSLLVTRKDPATPIVDLIYDARGNELDVSVVPNDYMKAQATFIGISLDDAQSAPTVTADTSSRVRFQEVLVYLTVPAISSTELTIPCALAGFNYTNGLDTDEAVLGSRDLYDLPYGNANCEVRFSPRTNIADLYREAMLEDPESCSLRIVALGSLIAGSTHFAVEFDFPAFEVIEAPAQVNAAEVLKMVEVTGRCKFDVGTSKFIKAIVTNDVASY